jgi:ATP-dependent exoDNAse (exonuclease V) alpha subunit
VILLDTLHSETASLSQEESYRLYQSVAKDYAHERDRQKRLAAIKNDKYFNALQIKFAYAMTCHKTQGGQWPVVFVEQPYLPDGEDISYLRWLYTALTRAQEKLYLIGFQEKYFGH